MTDPRQIQSKADRDRIRQRVGHNRVIVDGVRRLLKEYREGRAASACMADIEQLIDRAGRRRPE